MGVHSLKRSILAILSTSVVSFEGYKWFYISSYTPKDDLVSELPQVSAIRKKGVDSVLKMICNSELKTDFSCLSDDCVYTNQISEYTCLTEIRKAFDSKHQIAKSELTTDPVIYHFNNFTLLDCTFRFKIFGHEFPIIPRSYIKIYFDHDTEKVINILELANGAPLITPETHALLGPLCTRMRRFFGLLGTKFLKEV